MTTASTLRTVNSSPPYRRLFLICGCAHLLTGMIGLVVLPALFRPLGMSAPPVPFFWQVAAATTACFGLASFWIAQDPHRNRDLIQLWLCVKAAVAVLALWNIRVHGLRPPAGVLVVVDACWVGVFTSIVVRLGKDTPPS